ncbi:MAG: dihydropteroate synthase [Cyclobacteriaceae bacterium]
MDYLESAYQPTNLTQLDIQKTINVKGSILDLSSPKIMGIVNVTPDSFYAGSREVNTSDVLKKVEQMMIEGATFIDIGGYSSRPGADDLSEDAEWQRLAKPIEAISREFADLIISVDTFRSAVARRAIDTGAHVINDISGGDLDEAMFGTVADLNVPYIMMHMKGSPQNMVKKTSYNDLLTEVTEYFVSKLNQLNSLGVKDIIIDPGFGFAKNIEQNFQLLHDLNFLKKLDHPLLVGVSRKSMIYKSLNIQPEEALNGTTALNTVALLKGASILRVHDVKEAAEAVQLVNLLKI